MPWTPSDIIAIVKEILQPLLPALTTVALALIAQGVKKSTEKDIIATPKEVLKPADIQAALMFQIVQQAALIEKLEKDIAVLRAASMASTPAPTPPTERTQ